MTEHVNTSDAIEFALKKKKMKKGDLAKKMGIHPSALSGHIHRTKIGADVFLNVLSAMGYTVMVGKKSDDGFDPMWELEPEEE